MGGVKIILFVAIATAPSIRELSPGAVREAGTIIDPSNVPKGKKEMGISDGYAYPISSISSPVRQAPTEIFMQLMDATPLILVRSETDSTPIHL